MSEPTVGRDPFELVAESFLERFRAGQRPSVEEYAARHPELADQIRELLPALVMVEQDLTIDPDPGPNPAQPLLAPSAGKERRLGDYRILREIGRGGMGVVYEAQQVSLGRRVALKVLSGNVANDRMALERFRREAKAAARLHHTNIVPVFEVGRAGEVAYYAMQFIQGQGLDKVIDELARLRDPERKPGVAGGPGPTAAAAEPGAGGPALGRVAESLLSGRFATEGAVAATDILPAALPGPIEARRSTLDATHTSDFVLSDPEPAGDGPTTAPGPSAVLPDGSQVSPSYLSGRRARFFRGVAQIGRQAAQGLAYAHASGIVHRDIKPSNLLLDHAGVVWIADFGLAKGEDQGLTHTGDILGTLRYMAPERFRGQGDARADVYALGLTLYELLTLRPGFDSTDRLKLIEQIKTEEPPKPRSVDARIPRDLETIVLKAIEKDPRARYQSAEAMGEDLRRFLADEPIRARQVSVAERYWRWARRNPVIAVLGGVITALLVAGTAVASYFAFRASRGEQLALQNAIAAQANARQATQEMNRANLAAQKAIEEAARADQEAQHARDEKLLSDRHLYVLKIGLAQQAWREGMTDVLQQHLLSLEPKRPEDSDLRGFEWYYLKRLCQVDLRTLRGHSGSVSGVVYSPDGHFLASAGSDRSIRLWDAVGGREGRVLRGHAGEVLAVAYNPDGRTLASAGSDRAIRIWDVATGREVLTLSGHAGEVLAVAYSPDGHTLASASTDRTVRLWDAHTGREVHILSGHVAEVRCVAYSPDGRTLASGSGSPDRTVRLWDVRTGREVLTLRGHGAGIRGVAYSPDGRTVASASTDLSLRLWDATTGQVVHSLRGHTDWVQGVAYSPDGRTVASASTDQTVKLWDAAKGQLVQSLAAQQVLSVAYSPDGRHIAAAGKDETIRLWDISADREPVTLAGHTNGVLGVAYSPDGRTLASASFDRTVRIWEVATGWEVHSLRGHAGAVWRVAYSPDGRTLASAGHDHTVRLWDPATGREVRTLRGHTAAVLAVAYNPDSRTLASASVDRTVRLWDATTGRETRTLRGHMAQIDGLAYSPDGRTLASASSDRIIKLWDVATGLEVSTLRGHSGIVVGVAYSPNGRTLASASFDRTVRLWDATTGRETGVLIGRSTLVRGVAFSPDGRRMACAGEDGTVNLWDPATRQEVLTLRGHAGYVFQVAFSPDGRTLASTSSDRTVRLWDTTPLTPDVQAFRQAKRVVESLFAESLSTAEVLSRMRGQATLSAEARRLALELVEPYGNSLATHAAERLVESLYAKAMLRSEVVASLSADASLGVAARRQALALAECVPEDPERLDEASRLVVNRPGGGVAAYRLALRQAEVACRLIPADGDFIATLGLAQYRMEQYEEAVATLMEADRIHRDNRNGSSRPAVLAALALTRHRLGQTDQARALLSRLRETMKGPEWARNGDAQSWLHEAEVIELDVRFPADPFTHEAEESRR